MSGGCSGRTNKSNRGRKAAETQDTGMGDGKEVLKLRGVICEIMETAYSGRRKVNVLDVKSGE